jgi:hypothetical protein
MMINHKDFHGDCVEICLDFIDNNNTPPLCLVEAPLVPQLMACFKALISPINGDKESNRGCK